MLETASLGFLFSLLNAAARNKFHFIGQCPKVVLQSSFLAPEGISDPENVGEALDLFSLGAISYHIFSGQPPASSELELNQKLGEGRGLLISSVMDGTGKELQELIQFSTHPEVINRYTSVADFLTQLEAVEEELTRPEETFTQNPIEARAGDLLEGGFKVVSRLGQGSSAIAFLVEKDGKEVVLKLSNDAAGIQAAMEYRTVGRAS